VGSGKVSLGNLVIPTTQLKRSTCFRKFFPVVCEKKKGEVWRSSVVFQDIPKLSHISGEPSLNNTVKHGSTLKKKVLSFPFNIRSFYLFTGISKTDTDSKEILFYSSFQSKHSSHKLILHRRVFTTTRKWVNSAFFGIGRKKKRLLSQWIRISVSECRTVAIEIATPKSLSLCLYTGVTTLQRGTISIRTVLHSHVSHRHEQFIRSKWRCSKLKI